MENLFSENRLVYRGGGDRPRPREAANESNEVPNGKMLPLAKKMVKDMIDGNNGLSKSKFAKLKSQPDKQKKMIESWLKNYGLSKKEKENLMGTGTITEYYIGNKKVSPDKVATEVHTFIKDKANQKTIMDAIKKDKQQSERTSSAPVSEPEKVTTFYEDWEINRVKKFDSRINHGTLPKLVVKLVTQPAVGDVSVRRKGTRAERAKKFKAAVNKYLNDYGFYAKIYEESLQVKTDAYCYDKNKLKTIKSKNRERQFYSNFSKEVQKNFLS